MKDIILIEIFTKVLSLIIHIHNVSISSNHLLSEEIEHLYLETNCRISKLKYIVGMNIFAVFTFLH